MSNLANRSVTKHTEFIVTTSDGLRLFGQSWMPEQPRVLIAIAHGLAEHSGRYSDFAWAANAEGYGVVAVDLRGHGRSPGERLMIDVFDEFLLDVDALIDETKNVGGGCPVFLMGHSLGGAIALRWVSQRAAAVSLRGLILSSAALQAGPGTPAVLVKLAPFVSRWFPRLRLQALDAKLISSIQAEVVHYQTDPLVCQLAPPARTGAEVLAIMAKNLLAALKLTLPLYIFHGAGDTLTSPEGSQALYNAWGGPDKALRLWPGSLHETLNDVDRVAVMSELFSWLSVRAP